MSPARRIALLGLVLAACQDQPQVGPAVIGADPEVMGVGGPRAVLGVEGKPRVQLSTGEVVGDELLVRPRAAEELPTIAASVGAIVSRAPGATGYGVLRFASFNAAAAASTTLGRDARVVDVSWNHICQGTGPDTLPSLQWNLFAMGLRTHHMASAAGIRIAVLDTGVAYEEYSDSKGTYALAPELEDADIAAGYDFINDDSHPNDDHRHGTHIATVLVASESMVGVAPEATLIPVKVLDQTSLGTELSLAEGLRFATDQGADIINLSLAFPPTYFPSKLLQEAIDYASTRGVLLVAAAGNFGQGIVAYPAAFREVIAVGASALPAETLGHGRGHGHGQFWHSFRNRLVRAPYSDHGAKLDVLAPAGVADVDSNGDGVPEAVLGQTFVAGDPTSFGYYFISGTSQAAAEVSGLLATMLAANDDLDPMVARAILGETARRSGATLDPARGLGYVEARRALWRSYLADFSGTVRPRHFVNIGVALHDQPAGTVARARVEVVDEAKLPAVGVTVFGQFTGATFAPVQGVTDAAGFVEFESPALAGNLLVAFEVNAVVSQTGENWWDIQESVDRPRGFIRVDSRSLALLANLGLRLDNGGNGGGDSGVPGGAGPDTLPSMPIIPINPMQTPISIAFNPGLFSTTYRPTLLLANFSFGLATAPMAVAADESWFLSAFPEAASRRLVSRGLSIDIDFDRLPTLPPDVIVPPVIQLPLIVHTFAGDLGASIISDPAAEDAELITGLLAGETLSADPALVADLATVKSLYVAFAPTELASPVLAYAEALGAAGLPVAPLSPVADSGLGWFLFEL